MNPTALCHEKDTHTLFLDFAELKSQCETVVERYNASGLRDDLAFFNSSKISYTIRPLLLHRMFSHRNVNHVSATVRFPVRVGD